MGHPHFYGFGLAGWEPAKSFPADCRGIHLGLDFVASGSNRRGRTFEYPGNRDYRGSSSLCDNRRGKIVLRPIRQAQGYKEKFDISGICFGRGVRLPWKMDKTKSLADLENVKKNLDSNLHSYDGGNSSAYVDIAVKLRILLCDRRTADKKPLLERLNPNCRFHRIISMPSIIVDNPHAFFMPFEISSDGKGGSKIVRMFNDMYPADLTVDSWLDQRILNRDLSIKELILSVADKEGAHSDTEYDEILRYGQMIGLPSGQIHKEIIVAIGRYVAKILKTL